MPCGITQFDRVGGGLGHNPFFHENITDGLRLDVDGRAHNVEGRPLQQLGDEFPQIALVGLDALSRQRFV